MPASIVANGVSYDFHLLPSGLVNPNCLNFIGTGVVVHVPTFFSELEKTKAKGIIDAENRIFVSDRCHIDFDLHIAVDQAQETERGASSIGTTTKLARWCACSARGSWRSWRQARNRAWRSRRRSSPAISKR